MATFLMPVFMNHPESSSRTKELSHLVLKARHFSGSVFIRLEVPENSEKALDGIPLKVLDCSIG